MAIKMPIHLVTDRENNDGPLQASPQRSPNVKL
jgi:hypothetical protein